MKKKYISPALSFEDTLDLADIMTASIVSVGGETGIEKGGDEVEPNQGDARPFDVWDD
ncbi:hypothetical protein L6475_03980 [Prevotella sp. E9-3]|uniref:hypothetical protein n=1 Tax=Prevotella sp. E9-3 TaxID=2913621 RepID=UPI001EDC3B17|nr:hypothetical protein [Prevotella sp. E9-3]UKK49127.1 hypothetical protein L6475_03980 [Prevotella sp. E9-3]